LGLQFISRNIRNILLVGVVSQFPADDTLEFDNLARLTIGKDGNWNVTYTPYRDYFAYNWEHVWSGQTVDLGFDSLIMRATPINKYVRGEDCLALFPNQLSDLILDEPMWDAGRFQWLITWT
jgi:hypothetical protein